MSAAAAVADASPSPPVKKGKKKLIIIVAAVLVLVLGGGGAAAMLLMKKQPQEGDADTEQSESVEPGEQTAVGKPAERPAPVFVPLEPFTVNLADRDAERYAQVGITLEIADAKVGDQIKLYMPAIRNHFLLALADNTASDVMGREGKNRLAEKLRREASRALGYTVPEMAAAEKTAEEDEDEAPKKKKKKKDGKDGKDGKDMELPVRGVHFSNFIIQ